VSGAIASFVHSASSAHFIKVGVLLPVVKFVSPSRRRTRTNTGHRFAMINKRCTSRTKAKLDARLSALAMPNKDVKVYWKADIDRIKKRSRAR